MDAEIATSRALGESDIRQRKDGHWEGSVRVGLRRYHSEGQTRPEVAQKLLDIRMAVPDGRPVEPSRLTLESYLADWLAAQSVRRPTTRAGCVDLARLHAVPVLGTVRFQALKSLHLIHLYANRAEIVSPRRVQMVPRFLHKALRMPSGGGGCRATRQPMHLRPGRPGK